MIFLWIVTVGNSERECCSAAFVHPQVVVFEAKRLFKRAGCLGVFVCHSASDNPTTGGTRGVLIIPALAFDRDLLALCYKHKSRI